MLWRWLVFAPAAALALAAPGASAQGGAQAGLTVRGYNWSQAPLRSDDAQPLCGTGWYPNIEQQWDSQAFGDCGGDRFVLHYEGALQLPEGVNTVRFALAADDGGVVELAGQEFGTWDDKGCSWRYSPRIELGSAPVKFDAWFYENGGATCFHLWWQLDADNGDWTVVPPSAFTTELPATTTTEQTTTTTTEPPTTTTSEPPTTTTESTTTSTTPRTTTTQAPSTSIPASTSSSSTVVNTTTTTSSSTSTTLPEQTTTTAVLDTVPTEPEVQPPATDPAPDPEKVNVFDGTHDTYVPPGSTISVAKRRTVVAVSAVFFVMPLPTTSPSSRKERR